MLSGPLPRSLLDLSLNEFHYADTGLCVPPYETFRDWIGEIRSHAGTGVECAPLTDREILVRLYEATDGPNWENNTNWLTEAPLHQWHGVTTGAGGRVVRLDLGFNGLSGVVPPEIGGLSSLQVLDLGASGQRALGGLIPSELGQLRELRTLFLGHNGFIGPIPPEIGNASSLVVLNLSNNELIGTIPRELRQLSRLEALYLGLNNLTGELPSALGDLPRLQYVEFNRNLLLGPIPASLLRLDLRRFRFEENLGLCAPGTPRFVSWLGDIDETRGGFCNAGDAAVLARLHESAGGAGWTRSDGWLAGQPLSDWYGVVTDSLGHVRELDLSRNGLVGTLPSTLGDLSGLTALRPDRRKHPFRSSAALTDPTRRPGTPLRQYQPVCPRRRRVSGMAECGFVSRGHRSRVCGARRSRGPGNVVPSPRRTELAAGGWLVDRRAARRLGRRPG